MNYQIVKENDLTNEFLIIGIDKRDDIIKYFKTNNVVIANYALKMMQEQEDQLFEIKDKLNSTVNIDSFYRSVNIGTIYDEMCKFVEYYNSFPDSHSIYFEVDSSMNVIDTDHPQNNR